MKIHAAQLDATLKQQLAPCYFVAGDEPLILDESLSAIRQAVQAQGYLSRERFDLTPMFDCQALQQTLEHDSLFGDKKLVELHLGNGIMSAALKALLESYQAYDKTVLLISSNKLNTSQTKSKWYRQLEKVATVVQVWPLRRQQLPSFIRQRLHRAGFHVSDNTIQAIADQSEGNLLAIRQLIEKLTLLFEPGALDTNHVMQVLNADPHFDVFALGESVIHGESERCCTILNRLYQQGIDHTLILWALTREIRLLLTLLHGGRISVWQKRQAHYQHCLHRVNQPLLYRLLQQAARIDRIIKGAEEGEAQDQLLALTLQLANANAHPIKAAP